MLGIRHVNVGKKATERASVLGSSENRSLSEDIASLKALQTPKIAALKNLQL